MTAAGWDALVQHLASPEAGRGWTAAVEQRGPLPRGAVAPGSCSDEVLGFLRSRAGTPQTFAAIRRAVDRPKRSIAWSLVFLRRAGHVQSKNVVGGRCLWWASASTDADEARQEPATSVVSLAPRLEIDQPENEPNY